MIGEVSDWLSRPSTSVGLMTTSLLLFAVWKIEAKELLIVSVRT